jgi:hypothetical protein
MYKNIFYISWFAGLILHIYKPATSSHVNPDFSKQRLWLGFSLISELSSTTPEFRGSILMLSPVWDFGALLVLDSRSSQVHNSGSSQIHDSRRSQVHDSGSSRVRDSRRSQVHDSGSSPVHDLPEIDSRFTRRSQKWLLFSHITPKTYLINFVKPDVSCV